MAKPDRWSFEMSLRGRGASRFHSTFPVFRVRQIVTSASPSTAVTKIRDPIKIGGDPRRQSRLPYDILVHA